MIDWTKLKPYHHDKRKSFEQLCFQVAKKLYGSLGKFTPIDDSGGGDGVEFFLTLPDGTEWGWQAKFYFPQPRLNGSRKSSIIRSLKTSKEKHSRLTKWFLCTPTDFTAKGDDNELKWFEDMLRAEARDVEIEHWGDSEMSEMLSDPQMTGKYNYFFGDFELSPNWFAKQVDKQLARVRDKFYPSLHTETTLDRRIHSFLGDKSLEGSLNEVCGQIAEELRTLYSVTKKIQNHGTKDGWSDIAGLIHIINQLDQALKSATSGILEFRLLLNEGRVVEARKSDLTTVLATLYSHITEYETRYQSLSDTKIKFGDDLSDAEKSSNDSARHILSDLLQPLYSARSLAELTALASTQIDDFRTCDLHIFGQAGTGKTHLACHICNDRVSSEFPAILLHGGQFGMGQTIENKIREICDVPASCNWNSFLGAVESYAEACGTKVLVAIDSLNEASTIEVWRQGMASFISDLTRSPWIALITTCRTTYQMPVWNETPPPNSAYLHGFDSHSLEEAVTKYFEYFKIKADLTFAPLEQFLHPIYLGMFCQINNPNRLNEKDVFIGQETLFKVFERYLETIDTKVCYRLSKPPSAQIVRHSMNHFAQALWTNKTRQLKYEEVFLLLDGKHQNEVEWDKSITKALLDEGLLLARDWNSDRETVSFTYDLLGGYLISAVILQGQDASTLQALVNSELFKERLLSRDFRNSHPLNEDILRCLCAAMPACMGKHLYMLTTDPVAVSYSIEALFEMDSGHVGLEQTTLLRNLFKFPQNRTLLLTSALKTAFTAGHPLNSNFLFEMVKKLTIPDRDVSWSELVRQNARDLLVQITKFEKTFRESGATSGLVDIRYYLVARYLALLLTSTHRLLRDTTTRALYWYGRRYPKRLFDMTIESLTFNDPYVPERMLAASYGVAMAFHFDADKAQFRSTELPEYAHKIYATMFAKESPHSTTHVLMRDYARRVIDIAVTHHPNLLDKVELLRTRPPYKDGGIRIWGTSDDRDEEKYRDGNAPLMMDFENYTVGHLVPDRGNYDFNHPEYKSVLSNIFWRIYDLGYSLETFGEIDKLIAAGRWDRHEDNKGRIDRYGKKYSWIAWYELYGFREDNGLVQEQHPQYWGRPSDVDVDPSFPEEPANLKVVTADILGDRKQSLKSWIERGKLPNLLPFLVRDEVHSEKGPWVLIDGFVNQEEEASKRECFVFLRSFLVKTLHGDEFVTRLEKQNLSGRWLPEKPGDYYTFAGETAWSDTFPHNGLDELHFDTHKTRLVKRRIPGFDFVNKEDGTVIWTSKSQTQTVRERITRNLKALIPVRDNNWESYHSGANAGKRGVVLAKELAGKLGCWIKLPSWDMYDQQGRRATICTWWGEPWLTQQHCLFIRLDLLELYLKTSQMSLVWAIWGERKVRYSREGKLSGKELPGTPGFKVFQHILSYRHGKPLAGKKSEFSDRGQTKSYLGGHKMRSTKVDAKASTARSSRKKR